MDKRELRVGNWVTILGYNRDVIYEIKDNVIFSGSDKMKIEDPVLYDDISGVELTYDILLNNCGGLDNNIKESDTIYLECGDLYLTLSGSTNKDFNIRLSNSLFGGQSVKLKNIKFVHELQNLYFSLAKKELNIKWW